MMADGSPNKALTIMTGLLLADWNPQLGMDYWANSSWISRNVYLVESLE